MKTARDIFIGFLLFGTVAFASYIIPDGSITTAKLALLAVTNANLASNAVNTGNIVTGAVTQAKLAARTTGSTVGAGGVAVAQFSQFSTTNITPQSVTGASVTITTLGHPVVVAIVPSSTTVYSEFQCTANASVSGVSCNLQINNGGGMLVGWNLAGGGFPSSSSVYLNSPESYYHLDFPSAGTTTYSLKLSAQSVSTTALLSGASLIAYEI